MSMLEVLDQKWTRCRQASVPNEAFAVKAVEENIWVCHWSGIIVYDLNARRRGTVPCDDMGRIFDIVAIPDCDLVVVATSQGLYQMTREGSDHRKLVNGFFTSVVTAPPQRKVTQRICAAETSAEGQSGIHVFTTDGGDSWRLEYTLKTKQVGGFKTLAFCKNHLFVCHKDANKIEAYVLDSSGELTFVESHGGYGSKMGQFHWPFISGSDTSNGSGNDIISNDAILVSDSFNSRLQIMDESGHIKGKIYLQPAAKHPRSALVLKDRVYVISSDYPHYLHVYAPQNVSRLCSIL